MTPEQFQQIVEILGQVGNAAYQAARAQVRIDGVLNMLGGLAISIVILPFASRAGQFLARAKARNDEDGEGLGYLCIAGCLVVMSFGVYLVFLGMRRFMNPDWWALEYLSSLVR